MADLRSLVAGLRHYPDPAASTDPVTSALVTRLSSLPSPPTPSPGFRAELRAQLVAVAPRLVAEGLTPEGLTPDAGAESSTTARRPVDRLRAAWGRVPLRRPLAVVGTLVVVFALLLGGALWLSSSTLPGDSLYGLKRASENVQLSLTGGDGARGKEYLALAKRRADEVAKLLSKASALAGAAGPQAGAAGPQAAGGINTHTASLVTSTLDDADADLRNGSRLLTGQAVRNMSKDPLQTLLTWTPDQISRLTAIVNRIPAGSLHGRAAASEHLTVRLLDRANRLNGDIGCSCLTQTSSDDLGPLPCTLPCNPASTRPGAPNAPAPGGTATSPGGSGTPPSGQSTATGGASVSLPAIPGLPTGTGQTPQPTGTSSPTGSSGSNGLPGVSLPPASGSITVDSCGLTVTLGTIGLGLGSCGLHL